MDESSKVGDDERSLGSGDVQEKLPELSHPFGRKLGLHGLIDFLGSSEPKQVSGDFHQPVRFRRLSLLDKARQSVFGHGLPPFQLARWARRVNKYLYHLLKSLSITKARPKIVEGRA